jgi:hypothetical protein
VLFGLLLPARAAAVEPATVAKRLKSDPVFVENGAKPSLDEAGQGKVRIRIVQKAIGRIKVVVVRKRSVSGGLAAFAQAVDRDLGNRGALLLVAGDERFVLTSHPEADATKRAVERAANANEGEPLVDELEAAVDGIAEADPGPDSDLNAPETPGTPTIPGVNINPNPGSGPLVEVDTDGIAKVFAIVAAIVIGGLVLLATGFVVMRRRGHGRQRAKALRSARKELAKLGEEITALDLDTSMPGANATAMQAYEAGVTAYDEAEQLIGHGEPDLDAIREAGMTIARGRGHLSSARAAFDAAQLQAGGRPAQAP